ncbi:MAG: ThuA domain-containing protein [Verrucomicrobiales bacterium]|nr:ThuA domain-containing protein [Verrucomicrobiales bacterium]
MIDRSLFLIFLAGLNFAGGALFAEQGAKIVLIAGQVKPVDKMGHHDYLGGCRLMKALLKQTPGVEPVLVEKDWPEDESVFEGTKAVVFYTDGAGKQAYFATPERVALVQGLVDGGVGIVSLHQAVEYPPEFAAQSMAWIGGVYNALSSRGHWDSVHESFPEHAVTRGVVPWAINDGWLNRFKFPIGMKGVTPLAWSGKVKLGAPEGGAADVVAWAFERADGGRSFSFSGLDAHSAWEREGMRCLVINGVLWSAGLPIPEGGASCEGDKAFVDSFLTPRTAPPPKPVKK